MKLHRPALAALAAIAALASLSACAAGTTGSSGSTTPADVQPTTVHMSMNTGVYEWLPIYVAQKKGYFAAEKITLDIKPLQGSSASLLPLLARGDLDITPTVAAPALFNGIAGGFDIKLLASIGVPKTGWGEQGWIMVRQGRWDKGGLNGPKDLRGATFDGGPAGSPMNLVARQAIAEGGLTTNDLTFTQKLFAQGDQVAALQNGAVDFAAVTEPTATQLEAQGIAHKWLPASQIAPWAQQGMLAASGDFVKNHPDVVVRFLRAYLKGVADVDASGPKWTADMLSVATSFTSFPSDVFHGIGGPEYATPNGAISTDYISRVYQIWDTAGLITQAMNPTDAIDTKLLKKAVGG